MKKKKMNIKQLCIFYHVSSVSCCQALLAFHLIKRTHLYVKQTHLSMVFGDENKNVWEKDNWRFLQSQIGIVRVLCNLRK